MRDFFYNKGDVFIAVMIILVAAFVIYIRVGIIMDPSGEGALPVPSFWGTNEQAPEATTGEGNDIILEESGGQADDVQTEEPPEQTTPATIQITVNAGDAANVIADKLLAAGAITDTQAFLADVVAQGADQKLRIGTFSIPEGSGHLEIIAILVQ